MKNLHTLGHMWLTYKGRYDTSSFAVDRAENMSSQEKIKKIIKIQQTTQDVIYNKDLPRDTISCTAIHEEMSFFSLRASICSVRHRWRHQRNTSPPANVWVRVQYKQLFKEVPEPPLWCTVFAACWLVIWHYHRLQSGPWQRAHVHASVSIELLKSWHPTELWQKRWERFSRPDSGGFAISDNYLWYSAFQTRAEQPGDNLYKQTRCDYECITIQQTGNQHAMTCRATLQN